MALVTLILQDLPDGSVNVHAHCEPPLEQTADEPTKAQATLLVALNAIDRAAQDAAPQLWTPSN